MIDICMGGSILSFCLQRDSNCGSYSANHYTNLGVIGTSRVGTYVIGNVSRGSIIMVITNTTYLLNSQVSYDLYICFQSAATPKQDKGDSMHTMAMEL